MHADKLIDLRLDHVLVAATDRLRRGHLGWHDELGRLHLLALERLLEVCLVVWVRVVARRVALLAKARHASKLGDPSSVHKTEVVLTLVVESVTAGQVLRRLV